MTTEEEMLKDFEINILISQLIQKFVECMKQSEIIREDVSKVLENLGTLSETDLGSKRIRASYNFFEFMENLKKNLGRLGEYSEIGSQIIERFKLHTSTNSERDLENYDSHCLYDYESENDLEDKSPCDDCGCLYCNCCYLNDG